MERLRDKVRASFIIDKLEYLWKGGRCSGVTALGANLLRLKPCIEVEDGNMKVGKKFRGKLGDVLEEYVENRLKGRADLALDRIFITHAGIAQEPVSYTHLDVYKRQVGESARFIPVLGRVTAGQPILAVENVEDYLPFTSRLKRGSELFALRVMGESMIGAGILDGDIIVVERTPTAKNGEIVVVLIDDEATCKRFYKENGRCV